jgi:hypothetical protein
MEGFNDWVRDLPLLGKLLVLFGALIAAVIVLSIVMHVLEALVGVAVLVLIISGLIWVFQRVRRA